MPKTIELKPIKETTEDYDRIEARIMELLRKTIYVPIMKEIVLETNTKVLNAKRPLDDSVLWRAIRSGQIVFDQGRFRGKFSAAVSRELRSLGAKFDRKTSTYQIRLDKLPIPVRAAVASSEARFDKTVARIEERLGSILPAEVAEQLDVEKLFDKTLWRVNEDFKKSVKSITVAPDLTDEGRERISKEWQENLRLYIKNFTEKEVLELRARVKDTVFAGKRYESLVKTIQKSYGVSTNKAKFLARQETALMMAKFKEVRYQDAGVRLYKWQCVAGSKNHPVRPWHKALEGKIFSWQNPPVTTKPGDPVRRNNPGQDYNCRCYPIPVVKF